jgi:hypothetical protein
LLKSIIIPKGVLVLGENCFADCSKLSSVVFEPDSVLEQIGAIAFSECLPASLTVLSPESLSDITSLTSLTFASGSRLSEIQSSAFAHSDSLTSLFLPVSLSLIDGSSFLGSSIPPTHFISSPGRFFLPARKFCLSAAYFSQIDAYAFLDLPGGVGRASAAAPSSANAAFDSCFALRAICIPSRIAQIPQRCFARSASNPVIC